MQRNKITNPEDAIAELPLDKTNPPWFAAEHSLPFNNLTGDEFEVLCFLLLRKQYPNDEVYYFGKTADMGRDIIHIKANGIVRLIQCKNFSVNVDASKIAAEMAKVYTNVQLKHIPTPPDEVVFFVAKNLSAGAQDLIDSQNEWRDQAEDRLKTHLKHQPSEEILGFAKKWWPFGDRQTGVSITEDIKNHHPKLIEQFFSVQKVIDASRADLREDVTEIVSSALGKFSLHSPAKDAPKIDLSNLSLDEIRSSFEVASKSLANWPQTLAESKWIERPEEKTLLKLCNDKLEKECVLLGEPGSGKSALLARLASRFATDGVSCLGIKADTLDVNVDSIGKLSERLNLPATVDACIAALAATEKVVVLIDQLDALSDLVDLRSERLNVLLELINRLSFVPNVCVIASSRGFEYQHDSRFRTIDIQPISLGLPTWETASGILKELGIQGENWPDTFKEILRAPQNLKIFIEHLNGKSEQQIFDSYQGMLEELWQQKVVRSPSFEEKTHLLADVSEAMSELEVMWLPVARYDSSHSVIEELVADGILKLSENKLKFGFQHQTLYSHARARAVATGQVDFSDYVKARQHALFVRPTIWSTLSYLREASPDIYKNQMNRLCGGNLRLHIQHLLMDFLGRLTTPDDAEEMWWVRWLEDDDYRLRAILAITGSRGWFERLKDSQISSLMCDSTGVEWQLLRLLSAAINHSPKSTLSLLKKYWIEDPERDELTFRIFLDFEHWDEETVEIICAIVARTSINELYVSRIASTISVHKPKLAPRVFKTQFEHRLSLLKTQDDPSAKKLPSDATLSDHMVERIVHAPKKRFVDLLEASYDVPAIAEASPLEFLEHMWPPFVDAVEQALVPTHEIINRFRSCSSLHYRFEGRLRQEMPLIEALRISFRELGNTNPDKFASIFNSQTSSEAMIVQRILCRALSEITPVPANLALDFLTCDPRRLAIGDCQDDNKDSCLLIESLAEYLMQEQRLKLEESINRWSKYHTVIQGEDVETKQLRKKWDRENRLRILMAIPDHLLSLKGKAKKDSETVALPMVRHRVEAAETRSNVGMAAFKSPMATEQMRMAKDNDILNLFNELTSASKLDRPSHDIGTKIVYASRSLGELAKEFPKRVADICRKLTAIEQETPVSQVLWDIVESAFSTDELFELIRDLVTLGFDSYDFRDSVSHACYKRVFEVDGLPEDICSLLESWLEDWVFPEETDDNAAESNDEEDAKQSVIFDNRGIFTLPNRTYWILRALTYGLLRKKPIESARWLEGLQKHLARRERDIVWQALCKDLSWLVHCKQAETAEFVRSLFSHYPSVRDSWFGVRLVVELRTFLGENTFVELCEQYGRTTWPLGKQAKGELYGVSYLANDGFEAVNDCIERIMTDSFDQDSEFYRGLAFAVANLWQEAECRVEATNLFEVLANQNNKVVNGALADLFLFDKFLPEGSSKRILALAADAPDLVQQVSVFHFVKTLELFLSSIPETVLKLANILLDQLESDAKQEYRRNFDISDSALTGIAITLQRMDEQLRIAGLDLFERLLKLGFTSTVQTVRDLDNRPVNVCRPVHRRRRRKSK